VGKINILSRNYTPFAADKSFDEDAYRAQLQRFADSRILVFLASGGSGEANVLTPAELRRSFELGVEVFHKADMPVYANFPEVGTAQESIEMSRLAIETGIDVVNLYGPAGLHGYKPTDLELTTFFDDILAEVSDPVVLAPNPLQGYTPAAKVIADVTNRHQQVMGVNLVGLKGDGYFLELLDLLDRDVELNVALPGSLQSVSMGATGIISNLANIVPKTVRLYVDLLEAGDYEEMGRVYRGLERFARYVEGGVWHGPRWQKTAARALRLPGADGGVRLPYVLPSEEVQARFVDGLLKLGIAEIDEYAQAAGLAH
jgi:dihydrodipicolinate synthase/N-acetylneuraminate lyase